MWRCDIQHNRRLLYELVHQNPLIKLWLGSLAHHQRSQLRGSPSRSLHDLNLATTKNWIFTHEARSSRVFSSSSATAENIVRRERKRKADSISSTSERGNQHSRLVWRERKDQKDFPPRAWEFPEKTLKTRRSNGESSAEKINFPTFKASRRQGERERRRSQTDSQAYDSIFHLVHETPSLSTAASRRIDRVACCSWCVTFKKFSGGKRAQKSVRRERKSLWYESLMLWLMTSMEQKWNFPSWRRRWGGKKGEKSQAKSVVTTEKEKKEFQ